MGAQALLYIGSLTDLSSESHRAIAQRRTLQLDRRTFRKGYLEFASDTSGDKIPVMRSQ